MNEQRVQSIQVGRPRQIGGRDGRAWVSAIHKEPVTGPVFLRRLNLDGDGQADLRNHGGPDKAVCVYSAEHYPEWAAQLGRGPLPEGAFGENFTVVGVTERDVCIGDVFEVGDAVVQVSQPRAPCWKLARRWGAKDLAVRVQDSGTTGWYLRVLQEGVVVPGQPLRLRERPHAALSVAYVNDVHYGRRDDADAAAALAVCADLSESWRRRFERRVE